MSAGALVDRKERAPALVPLQDLAAHNAPLRGELMAAAERVLASGRYILGGAPGSPVEGSEVVAFEREAAAAFGVSQAVGMSSGSDALLAVLLAAGVGPGDEVVTTPLSFVASAEAIARVGARPMFADVDARTMNLDPAAAAACLSPRTRAVLPVHLYGRLAATCDLEDLCRRRDMALLEDAAQAVGAVDDRGRGPGQLGRAAALSFFPSKNLGALGDGGMVLTNDSQFAERVRRLRVHGASAKFHHVAVGGNLRLDELQAAFLRVKLPYLPAWTAARRRVARIYREGLAGLPLALPPDDAGAVWNQFVVCVPAGQRDRVRAVLDHRGIETAVYYPKPLHLQPCFAHLGHRPGDFPSAEEACRRVLALPIYPELSQGQIAHVVTALRAAFAAS